MKVYAPSYYNQFRCIASRCPDSCCKGWAVDVDSASAARYRALPGALGDRLRAVLCDGDNGAYMQIEDSRCPMWRSDSLCRIQAELGHEALCRVCQTFPRLRHDYGDFAELDLELSCPEAARLILTEPAAICMDEEPGGESPDYEPELMELLLRSRAQALALTEELGYSVPELLAILLLHAHEVQAQIDGAEAFPFSPADALADARRYAATGDQAAFLDFFKDLEILDPSWLQRLEAPAPSPWTELYRPMIRYFLRRWWLQAVSDYDLLSRVKLAVSACLVIHALGGNTVETAQAFSKEIENDADNVDAILDGAYTSPALTDVQLLSLLLNP